ncbi:MAG TPA: aldo/keto reductase [Clostridia bacterium]|nr:aldo/keto reductase [Clostridia bacterium]
MNYMKIKNTDITVSKMALGTWVFSNDATWGSQEDELSIKTTHAAIDAGITLIDTAAMYGSGRSEIVLGKALKGRRDKVVVATKTADANPTKDTVIKACEDSLRRLDTDYIDIYQIHWPRRTVPFSETMEGLLKLYKDGKIRAIGVSNFGIQDLNEITKFGPVHTNQMAYNLLFRAIDHEIRPLCIEKEIGILCNSPLAQGLCTGKYSSIDQIPDRLKRVWYLSDEFKHLHPYIFQTINCIKNIAKSINQPLSAVAIAYDMHREGIVSVLAGARNTEQLKQNISAAELKLNKGIMDNLDECTDELFNLMGYNADMWRVESTIK